MLVSHCQCQFWRFWQNWTNIAALFKIFIRATDKKLFFLNSARLRTVTREAAHGGSGCRELVDVKRCNSNLCSGNNSLVTMLYIWLEQFRCTFRCQFLISKVWLKDQIYPGGQSQSGSDYYGGDGYDSSVNGYDNYGDESNSNHNAHVPVSMEGPVDMPTIGDSWQTADGEDYDYSGSGSGHWDDWYDSYWYDY